MRGNRVSVVVINGKKILRLTANWSELFGLFNSVSIFQEERMKKKTMLIIASAIAITLLSAGCNLNGNSSNDTVTYNLRDEGPAGGLIFYIDTAEEYTWTYLEVAPASTEWAGKQWCDNDTVIGAGGGYGIGDGQTATDAIVQYLADHTGQTGKAAQLCDGLEHDHDGTTYDDWFLPSKDELNAIWDNIVDDGSGSNSGVGGFDTAAYWSSSEYNSVEAWGQIFENGNQVGGVKNTNARVRAVRAF